jgi:hypothetical protein
MVLWNQRNNTKTLFKFGDFVLWFPKGSTSHLGKLLTFFFILLKLGFLVFKFPSSGLYFINELLHIKNLDIIILSQMKKKN